MPIMEYGRINKENSVSSEQDQISFREFLTNRTNHMILANNHKSRIHNPRISSV